MAKQTEGTLSIHMDGSIDQCIGDGETIRDQGSVTSYNQDKRCKQVLLMSLACFVQASIEATGRKLT